MPRPLSDSWQYFDLLEQTDGRSRKASCIFCGHVQAAGITRLHQHLLYRCSRIPPDIREVLKQKQEDKDRESSTPEENELLLPNSQNVQQQQQNQEAAHYNFDASMQNTLSNSNDNTQNSSPLNRNNINSQNAYYEAALSPTASTNFTTATPIAFPPSTNTDPTNTLGQQHDRSQAMLDCQLARALFSANIPLQSIENSLLVDFLKCLQPNYVVPKARTLQRMLLKEQHWDLIRWNTEPNLLLQQRANQSPPIPPPPSNILQQQQLHQQHQQQQQRRVALSSHSSNNNTGNNGSNTKSNRLLASLPPSDLEGSL